ncbi:MAG: polysaccharide biosynthesis/export family protein [Pseudomonadota bacterium]
MTIFFSNGRLPRHAALLACVAAALGASACASTTDREELEALGVYSETLPEISIEEMLATSRRDVFKRGDRVLVEVFNIEELSGSYMVNRSGNVMLPLIGSVPASGKTTEQLQDEITRLYGEQYLNNPSVNVDMKAAELGKIVVDGAVVKPGAFELTELVNLSEAVAMAEGLSEDANPKEVMVVRQRDGRSHVKIANLTEIRLAREADPQLAPGDIVFVQESASRMAFREFLRTVPLINAALIYETRR